MKNCYEVLMARLYELTLTGRGRRVGRVVTKG